MSTVAVALQQAGYEYLKALNDYGAWMHEAGWLVHEQLSIMTVIQEWLEEGVTPKNTWVNWLDRGRRAAEDWHGRAKAIRNGDRSVGTIESHRLINEHDRLLQRIAELEANQ